MMTSPLRPGGLQGMASLVLAATTAAIIVAAAPLATEVGGRLALTALVFYGIVLIVGSARLVGLSSILMLGAALASTSSTDPEWVRSIVIGCVWYAAIEIGWSSIEQRKGAERTAAFNRRRVNEVATVVALAVIVTLAGLVGSGAAAERTLIAQAPIVLGLVAAVALITRSLERA
ncbi:MAG: hypothetical protein ACR2P0_03200 [Acidimicrobiales bacterium]